MSAFLTSAYTVVNFARGTKQMTDKARRLLNSVQQPNSGEHDKSQLSRLQAAQLSQRLDCLLEPVTTLLLYSTDKGSTSVQGILLNGLQVLQAVYFFCEQHNTTEQLGETEQSLLDVAVEFHLKQLDFVCQSVTMALATVTHLASCGGTGSLQSRHQPFDIGVSASALLRASTRIGDVQAVAGGGGELCVVVGTMVKTTYKKQQQPQNRGGGGGDAATSSSLNPTGMATTYVSSRRNRRNATSYPAKMKLIMMGHRFVLRVDPVNRLLNEHGGQESSPRPFLVEKGGESASAAGRQGSMEFPIAVSLHFELGVKPDVPEQSRVKAQQVEDHRHDKSEGDLHGTSATTVPGRAISKNKTRSDQLNSRQPVLSFVVDSAVGSTVDTELDAELDFQLVFPTAPGGGRGDRQAEAESSGGSTSSRAHGGGRASRERGQVDSQADQMSDLLDITSTPNYTTGGTSSSSVVEYEFTFDMVGNCKHPTTAADGSSSNTSSFWKNVVSPVEFLYTARLCAADEARSVTGLLPPPPPHQKTTRHEPRDQVNPRPSPVDHDYDDAARRAEQQSTSSPGDHEDEESHSPIPEMSKRNSGVTLGGSAWSSAPAWSSAEAVPRPAPELFSTPYFSSGAGHSTGSSGEQQGFHLRLTDDVLERLLSCRPLRAKPTLILKDPPPPTSRRKSERGEGTSSKEQLQQQSRPVAQAAGSELTPSAQHTWESTKQIRLKEGTSSGLAEASSTKPVPAAFATTSSDEFPIPPLAAVDQPDRNTPPAQHASLSGAAPPQSPDDKAASCNLPGQDEIDEEVDQMESASENEGGF
ncbi:unnamed protein product [Amoebophrya sp. A25]|nr:unnamed protein product [Amoebophrya sp. A25]|eukprot:GSA25T00003509001.1